MLRKQVFDEVDGFDEKFVVAYNDVDLCMRIRQSRYWIVWTPHARLYHYESKTRGREDATTDKKKKERLDPEAQLFIQTWWNELQAGDPFYSPNLSLDREDFSLNWYPTASESETGQKWAACAASRPNTSVTLVRTTCMVRS
jgi:hypothetical protein